MGNSNYIYKGIALCFITRFNEKYIYNFKICHQIRIIHGKVSWNEIIYELKDYLIFLFFIVNLKRFINFKITVLEYVKNTNITYTVCSNNAYVFLEQKNTTK